MFKWINKNEEQSRGLTLWTGVEITCLLDGFLVHVIALDFDMCNPAMNKYITGDVPKPCYLQAETVVKSVKQSGGITILAHPARYKKSYKHLIEMASKLGFDGAEAWYDYEFKNTWKPTHYICKQIDLFLKNNNMLSSCGTDTHGFSLSRR